MPVLIDLPRLSAPLPLFDVAATRRLEQAALARCPPHTLMRRAGLAVARLALAIRPHARCVWLACGPGNNGGDGLEAAMHLHAWGLDAVVTWLGDEARLPADARASLHRARAAGVRFADTPPDPDSMGPDDLCIDALLGLGAARPPEGRMAALLAHMQALACQRGVPLLAVDLPSGLSADTGVWHMAKTPDLIAQNPLWACLDGSFSSDTQTPQTPERHTLSLLTLKPGLFTAQGRDACGTLWLDDLGLSPADMALPPSAWLNAPVLARPRPHDSHKGSFGDVAIIGGQHGRNSAMTGAALLAASAALHGGAGRVWLSLLPEGDDNHPPSPPPASAPPELMLRHWRTLPLHSLTVVCGCGGGQAVRATLPDVLAQAPRLVLDADALNAVAQDPALAAALASRHMRGQASLITPHPLEAARLLGITAAQVQADRLRAAHRLALRLNCAVALKGSGTIIAAPQQTPRINPSGNARLAAPGTGDVLAGLAGACLAAGQTPFASACAATYRHGHIADQWPVHAGTLTASALARRL